MPRNDRVPFHAGVFNPATGQLFDLSAHFKAVKWIDDGNKRVAILATVHNRWSGEALAMALSGLDPSRGFTLISGPATQTWNWRKARVKLGDPPTNWEYEFVGEEWFGPYY